MSKKMKKVPVLFMAAVLVVGVAAGAGVWLLNVEVPVEYDEPYTISMSEEEYDDFAWEELPFREGTTLQDVYFGENEPDFEYYQHVRIENPADSGELSLNYEVESDEHVEFMVMDELVEPGDLEEPDEFPDREESVFENVEVDEGETKEFTVIHIVDGVEDGGEEDIYWTFYEGEEGDIPLSVPEDYDTIQGAIDAAEEGQTILVEPDTYDESFTIDKEGLTLMSLEGPEETTINTQGSDIGIRISADSVTFEGFTVEGFNHYGIQAGDPGATSDFHRNDVTIRNNIVPEDVVTNGGEQPAAVYLPAVDGALVENNELGVQDEGWALDASKSRNIEVNNNRIFQEDEGITGHAGILMDGETFEGIGGHEIIGNTIEGFSSGRGIYLMAHFGPIEDIVIEENQIQNNEKGINLFEEDIKGIRANYNNIIDNDVGVNNPEAEEVDATSNYWDGNEDKAEGNVDTSEELDDPVEDAGADWL